MKFSELGSLVGGWRMRLVVIQLGGRAVREAGSKLCAKKKLAGCPRDGSRWSAEHDMHSHESRLGGFARTMKDWSVGRGAPH